MRKLIVGHCALCSGYVLCIFVRDCGWFVQYKIVYRYYILICVHHFFLVPLYFGGRYSVCGFECYLYVGVFEQVFLFFL